MIKVLNISSDMNIGGAGRCVINFLKFYDRENFRVSVALPRGSLLKPELEKLDTPVIEVDGIADKSLDLKAIRKLRRVIREAAPDLVHTHGVMSARIAARLAGCGIIYTRHSVFPISSVLRRNPGKWINGRVNGFFADEIIAVAQAAKKNLTDSGISPERVTVLLNGVPGLTPLPGDEIQKEKNLLGIEAGDFVIGILARLEEVKGHIHLLEAADILKKQGRKIKVLIAGTGAMEEALVRKSEEMGLEDTVIFLGFVERVDRLLSIIDLQVNASFGTEATSLALLEGMSMGIPAVVSDYGGNPGVISHGENGLIFKARDSGALAAAIARVMDDSALLSDLRKKSAEIFEKKFTAEIYAEKIQAVYTRAAQKRGR